MNVLLVEDDALIRECLGQTLMDTGMTTDLAGRAEEALRLLALSPPPDVLITDIDLGPGMDGLCLARVARRLCPALKIVFISGRTATLRGLDPQERFLAKPFVFATLERTLAELSGSLLPAA